MINAIKISGFKCFEHLKIDTTRRINVLVGENGSGKTSFLEGVFLTLSGNSDLVQRFRQQRGIDGFMRGTPHRIVEVYTRDLFYANNIERDISIEINGTDGDERSLTVTSNVPDGEIRSLAWGNQHFVKAVKFVWKDYREVKRIAYLGFTDANQLQFTTTNEDLPDSFYFPAQGTHSASDNAEKYSVLSRNERQNEVFRRILEEYPWIRNLSIEVEAGIPGVYAKIDGLIEKLQISNISGGLNRFVTILLTIASKRKSLILTDELDSGLYYTHHEMYWRTLIDAARAFNSQLFIVTHSLEWLQAMTVAADDKFDDICLWRMLRGGEGPIVKQFSGKSVKTVIEAGGELR